MKRRGGFTLVEVLGATALAALVLAGLLALATRVRASGARMAAAAEATDPGQGLESLLRWDLEQATEIELEGDRLVLEGAGALDPRTLEPLQRPVRIVYRVLEPDREATRRTGDASTSGGASGGGGGGASGGGRWLVRSQRLLDVEPAAVDAAKPWIELVAALQPRGGRRTGEGGEGEAAGFAVEIEGSPVHTVTVRIDTAGDGDARRSRPSGAGGGGGGSVTSGTSGASGTSGTSGTSGASGTSGTSGGWGFERRFLLR